MYYYIVNTSNQMLPTYVFYMVGAYEKQRFSNDGTKVCFFTKVKLEAEQDIPKSELMQILSSSEWIKDI